MSDLALLAASVKDTLVEISKQAQGLGVGLQNVAPSEVSGKKLISKTNNSVEYLLGIAKHLEDYAKTCDQLLNESSRTD